MQLEVCDQRFSPLARIVTIQSIEPEFRSFLQLVVDSPCVGHFLQGSLAFLVERVLSLVRVQSTLLLLPLIGQYLQGTFCLQ